MKTIIVPIDFSEFSLEGLRFALQLSRKLDANVEMVYVQPCKPDFAHVGREVEHAKATKAFEALIAQYANQVGEGRSLTYIIKVGRVPQEVVAQSNSYAESIIVTSTHGASGFEELFVGSNTLRILAQSNHPTFTIRHGVEFSGCEHIIFPLDITNESRQKAPYVAELATAFGATVHVVGILETPNKDLRERLARHGEQLAEYFKGRKVEVTIDHITYVDIVEGVIEQAAHYPNALIAVTSRNRNTLPLLMLGGRAQRLLSRSEVPVLVLSPTVAAVKDSFRTMGF